MCSVFRPIYKYTLAHSMQNQRTKIRYCSFCSSLGSLSPIWGQGNSSSARWRAVGGICSYADYVTIILLYDKSQCSPRLRFLSFVCSFFFLFFFWGGGWGVGAGGFLYVLLLAKTCASYVSFPNFWGLTTLMKFQ